MIHERIRGINSRFYFYGQRFVHVNAVGSTTKGASVEYLMLPREIGVMKDLDEKFQREHGYPPTGNDDLIYYLGDNPSWAATWSAKSGKIPHTDAAVGCTYTGRA